MLVPVYDIVNCGPRHRFVANGKLVHNSDQLNLQNIPRRSILKQSMKAPPGYVVIDCDSAQIEARTLAWLAGQNDLVEAFRNKEDVYKKTAGGLFGIAPEEVNDEQRRYGKIVTLGCGYGVGAEKLRIFLKLQTGTDISLDEAKRFVSAYRALYPHIPLLWRRGQRALEAHLLGVEFDIDVHGLCRMTPKGITMPNGLHIQYPGLYAVEDEKGKQYTYTGKNGPTRIYSGKVVENICQFVARCVVAEQMLRISKRYPVKLTVHDAAAIVVPVSVAEEARAFVEDCMSWVPPWAPGLPLACESGMGASYGDC